MSRRVTSYPTTKTPDLQPAKGDSATKTSHDGGPPHSPIRRVASRACVGDHMYVPYTASVKALRAVAVAVADAYAGRTPAGSVHCSTDQGEKCILSCFQVPTKTDVEGWRSITRFGDKLVPNSLSVTLR